MVKPLPKRPTTTKPGFNPRPFWIIGFVIVVIFAAKPFLEKDGETWRVAEWRRKQLDDKVFELQNAEQYSLRARVSGYYPCYLCKSGQVFLNLDEVWKYGVTSKGQSVRYSEQYLNENKLRYVVEFEGSLQLCLEEEARKLYLYPELPENLKRAEPLFLPLGNKITK